MIYEIIEIKIIEHLFLIIFQAANVEKNNDVKKHNKSVDSVLIHSKYHFQ